MNALQKQGAATFTITSPDFTNRGTIPAPMTCDGKAFGTGSSPTLPWSEAPTGTVSVALVFEDISILAGNNPATARLGYHWVMWDIPGSRAALPPGLTGGYPSTEPAGAAVTEYRGTSKAWSTSFAPPTPAQHPCVSSGGGAPPPPDRRHGGRRHDRRVPAGMT
jgi:phosphatidylethanolamine-binding protein (PEBP) family uncharacterized protein